MDKDIIKEKMSEIEEQYKKINNQIEQLSQNKYRLEGQFGLLKDMLEEDVDGEELEEIGD